MEIGGKLKNRSKTPPEPINVTQPVEEPKKAEPEVEYKPDLIPDPKEKIQLSENIISYFDDLSGETFNPITCNYKGIPRPVHPTTCQYHRDMKDPECQKCERY